ncbi:MAG TPA: hypothetical protein VEC06_21330 [Paucimonas sp.]|nr:hypothetical protein [Paucimonas sp.]
MAGNSKIFTTEAGAAGGSGKERPGQGAQASVTHGAPQDGRQLQEVVEEQQFAEMPSLLDGRNFQDEGQPQQEADRSKRLTLGTHIARYLAIRLPNGSYEAQVYVRLAREPEVAETYIPAGTFVQESEAWSAAEERARRALDEREF